MKYVYQIVLKHVTINGTGSVTSTNFSDYIKAMEGVKDAMEFAWQYYGVSKDYFNEIHNVAGWIWKELGYVRAWKAITDDDICTIDLYRIKLDNDEMEKWL